MWDLCRQFVEGEGPRRGRHACGIFFSNDNEVGIGKGRQVGKTNRLARAAPGRGSRRDRGTGGDPRRSASRGAQRGRCASRKTGNASPAAPCSLRSSSSYKSPIVAPIYLYYRSSPDCQVWFLPGYTPCQHSQLSPVRISASSLIFLAAHTCIQLFPVNHRLQCFRQ